MRKIAVILLMFFAFYIPTQAKHRKKVKRFSESLTPIQDFLNQQKAMTNDLPLFQKSNIPFTPASLNSFQTSDDNTQEIPIGPLMPIEEEKPEGDVHLKDLLTFIRKTNIPEDPFAEEAPSTTSEILEPPSQIRSIETSNIFNDQPLRRFHIPNIQEHANGLLSPMKRFFLHQNIPFTDRLTDRYNQQFLLPIGDTLERKNKIPHTPNQIIKKSMLRSSIPILRQKMRQPSMIDTVKRAQKNVALRSDVPKIIQLHALQAIISKPKIIDPYEGLKQAIIKKAATDTLPALTIKSKRYIIANATSNTESEDLPEARFASLNKEHLSLEIERDPYDELKRAISNKEDAEDEDEKSQIQKSNILTIDEMQKKDVRKDQIPDSDMKKQSIVRDANNEPESKRSVPVEPPSDWETKRSQYPMNAQTQAVVDQQFDAPSLSTINAAQLNIASQFVTKSNIPTIQGYTSNHEVNIINQGYQPPIANYMTSENDNSVQMRSSVATDNEQIDNMDTNATLPTGEELERAKIQREMHLIDQLQNMKKSKIPHVEDGMFSNQISDSNAQYTYRPQQINSYLAPVDSTVANINEEQSNEKKSDIPNTNSFHDSTPLVLHKHPAEGVRENIFQPPLPVIPPIQIMMKKDNIPSPPEMTETRSNILQPSMYMQRAYQTMYQLPVNTYNFESYLPLSGMKLVPQKQPTLEENPISKKSTVPGTSDTSKNWNGTPILVSEDENKNDDIQTADLLTQEVNVQTPDLKPEPEKTEDGTKKDSIYPSNLPADSFPLRLRMLPPT